MATLTTTGLATRSVTEIVDEIGADITAELGAGVNLAPNEPLGQLVAIVARQIAQIEEAVAATYAGFSGSAAGVMLDLIASMTHTVREAATASRVELTVNVDPGTYAAGALVVQVFDDPTVQFANVEAVTNSGGSTADVTASFESLTTGAVAAPSGTLVISGPVAGWNSVTHTADATLGLEAESDAALRLRRLVELSANAVNQADAIRAAILRNVSDVNTVRVLQNREPTADASTGLDPHTIEVIVDGPSAPTDADNDAVAEQIFARIAAGTGMAGNIERTVTDDSGRSQSILFTRATEVRCTASVHLEYDATSYAGDSATAIGIADALSFGAGETLDWSEVLVAAMAQPGVVRVTGVWLAQHPAAEALFTSQSMTAREVAALASGDITIYSAAGSA